MATAETGGEERECPVCSELFACPKILLCGHVICRSCVISWLKVSTEAQCPLCRCLMIDTGKSLDKTCEQLADGLPTDLAMEALVESEVRLNQQQTCLVHDDEAAVSLCLDCNEMFCQVCCDVHVKMSVTQHHTLKDIATLTPDTLTSSRPLVCDAHPDTKADLYCSTHDVPICKACISLDHQTCTQEDLQIKLTEVRETLSSLHSMLTSLESALLHSGNMAEKHVVDVGTYTRLALGEIDAACDSLQQSVDQIRKRLKDIARETEASNCRSLLERKAALAQVRGQVTSHRLLVKRVCDSVPNSVVMHMLDTLRARTTDLNLPKSIDSYASAVHVKRLSVDSKKLTKIERDISTLSMPASTVPLPLIIPVTSPVTAADLTTTPTGQGVFRFHAVHGENIELWNECQTARRMSGITSGIVFSSEVMRVNCLYEVHVDEVDVQWVWTMQVGVTWQNPNTFDNLPDWTVELPSSKIITSIELENRVCKIEAGSRLGLVLDSSSCLHLFFNGIDKGVVAQNVQQPCWAMYDVRRQCIQITVLPVKTIQLTSR